MLLHKDKKEIDLQQTKTKLKDMLVVKGTIKKYKTTIILVYLSVVKGEEEKKANEDMKKEVRRHIENCEDEELIFLLGDFNGHIGILGNQQLNYNGKLVMDIKTECDLILLNSTEKCDGTYTWSRGDQRSAIDFVIVNNNALKICQSMKIDEGQDVFDLSDHNLIQVELKLHSMHYNFAVNSDWKETEYYKLDDDSIERYITELEELLKDTDDISIDTFNHMIDEAATRTLKRSYKRRVTNGIEKKEEPPWITKEIRAAIKKRKQLNRNKRNCPDELKEMAIKQYTEQKRVVQTLVYEAIQKHEDKITKDIKTDKGSRKKLWDNIDRLRGKPKTRKQECKLYNEKGEKLEKDEAEEEIKEFWTNIYKKHENNIEDVWNEETKNEYSKIIERENNETDYIIYNGHKFPTILREHYDMDIAIEKRIQPMAYPTITINELKTHLKKIKKNKATGPDNIKGELYTALQKSDICTRKLHDILQNILDNETKVKTWEKSNTTMVPKVKKPTAKQLRPIALMDVSYKLYMKIQGKKIDEHLIHNNEQIGTQAGFTSGCQIEDNLFVLQYCIEETFKKRKPLIVTSIDYAKAFDSIKRDTIITTLMHYRIHHKIIETIANIYQEDNTEIKFGDLHQNINITSGIRQGCTGSTTLFKIITYMIISELNSRGTGYKDDTIKINSLYFADDGLLLANNIEDATNNLKMVMQISREFGLEINKEKSNIIIFNMEQQPDTIEDIKVVNKIKYLGIEIDNKRNYFKTQRQNMLTKARKMANLTYCIIEKSCNKLLIGKTYWKNIILPSILYGTNIINLSEDDIRELQTIEYGVYRSILNAPPYAPNTTLRGEIGASLMKKRIMNGRLNYMKSIQSGRNEILHTILDKLIIEQGTKWMKTTQKYMDEVKLKVTDIEMQSKEEIKQKLIAWDNKQWKHEIESKSSLLIYRQYKDKIQEENIYDNRPSSTIFYKARTNTLPLNDRNRHKNKETHQT